jgi:hypothetical protein
MTQAERAQIRKEVLLAWRDVLCRKSQRLNLDESHWEDLFIGFAMGKGLTIQETRAYRLYGKAFYFEVHPNASYEEMEKALK